MGGAVIAVRGLVAIAAIAVAGVTASALERTETPICGFEYDAGLEVLFAAEEIDGVAVRVESYRSGGHLVDATETLIPCWWDTRREESVPFCMYDAAVQRYTPAPSEYAWSAWAAHYVEDEFGLRFSNWALCLDCLFCNDRPCEDGGCDSYMAWPEICLEGDLPCCGNPDCPAGVTP